MHLSYVYALIAVLCWSTAASAFKLSLRYIDPIILQTIAVPSATVFFISVLAVRGQCNTLLQQSKRSIIYSACMGFLNPLLYYQVLFLAYDRLPAQEAAVLNYIWPLTLVLLSIPLLGQRLSTQSTIALILSFLGVLIIGTRGQLSSLEFKDPLGVSLAIGSSVVWSLFWLGNVRDKRPPLLKLTTAFIFCSCYIGGLALFHLRNGAAFIRGSMWHGIAGAVYVGLIEMGIAYILWLKALSTARSTAYISNLIFLSPFLSLIWINLFVGESLLPSTASGFLCIIFGIILQQRSKASTFSQ
jgi:drug/metabolite transporter (DMT)-like permease